MRVRTTRPTLSVIIPVYNAADCLAATLAEVTEFAAASTRSLEVLFVDDHSDDVETPLALNDFARRHPWARVLRNSDNRGKGFSVARGMIAARGDYRVFIDVDLAYPLDQVD